ncbi:hypothetical protein LY78DRAFT_661211 [Colletotrichum sublineola]|nr:hypothetical protein LY78DRAFT_661211 [Colletotrichum sublineola]
MCPADKAKAPSKTSYNDCLPHLPSARLLTDASSKAMLIDTPTPLTACNSASLETHSPSPEPHHTSYLIHIPRL